MCIPNVSALVVWAFVLHIYQFTYHVYSTGSRFHDMNKKGFSYLMHILHFNPTIATLCISGCICWKAKMYCPLGHALAHQLVSDGHPRCDTCAAAVTSGEMRWKCPQCDYGECEACVNEKKARATLSARMCVGAHV